MLYYLNLKENICFNQVVKNQKIAWIIYSRNFLQKRKKVKKVVKKVIKKAVEIVSQIIAKQKIKKRKLLVKNTNDLNQCLKYYDENY